MSKLALALIKEAKITQRKKLDLGNCGLREIPPAVFELDSLEELSLCNQYWDHEKIAWINSKGQGEINIIKELPNDFIKLRNLKVLKIAGDKETGKWDISNAKVLKNLIELKYLDISFNRISDTTFLENLKELTYLDISDNQITDVSFLKNLKKLYTLYIQNNEIAYPHFLGNLKELTHLDIGYNKIFDAAFLRNLKKLNTLYINDNKVINNDNKIIDVSFLKNLKELKALYINSNQIINAPFLKNLTTLTHLEINDNQITDISSLMYLTTLTHLDISDNQITDISSLMYLTTLTHLDIRGNKISDFTPLLHLVKKGLPVKIGYDGKSYGIYTANNPWSTPPPEIIKSGNKAILNYYEELAKQGEDYLFEAKMLIVGKGGVGKTSLIKKLFDRQAELPKEEATTKGVDIEKYSFNCESGENFILNLWDFGGQEIYHATHQFFLTKRSLYVLVDDTKDDDRSVNDASFIYWLQIVELFGAGSPLLIFQNEKGGRSKGLDIKSMQGRFDFIRETYADDLKNLKTGVNEFEIGIKYHAQKLPHIGQKVPKQWVKIRAELQEIAKDKPYISSETYFDICAKYEITEKEKMLHLSQYLHDLGTFLHFQKDDLLRKSVILNNEWATDAVYKVLDNETIKANKGIFTKEEAAKTWSESTYSEMHPELLALMLKFELCYKLTNQQDSYLIPQLLPESQPDDIAWDIIDNLQLRYKYEFMPKGLLSRFIVRTHRYLENIDNCWKKGMILEKDQTHALVEEKFGINEIAIQVRGKHQKDLLTIIAEKLDTLNGEYQGIKVQKLIPCNCTTCDELENPHFYNYQEIIDRYALKKETIECSKVPFEVVSVIGLLDNFLKDYINEIEGKRSKSPSKKKIFISHASEDKEFVRKLASELENSEIECWVDESEIKVGDSITSKIEEGLGNADYVIYILSKNSVASNWVAQEWKAIYFEAVDKDEVMILPILLEDCEIPILLKDKKYANFKNDFQEGFKELLRKLRPS